MCPTGAVQDPGSEAMGDAAVSRRRDQLQRDKRHPRQRPWRLQWTLLYAIGGSLLLWLLVGAAIFALF